MLGWRVIDSPRLAPVTRTTRFILTPQLDSVTYQSSDISLITGIQFLPQTVVGVIVNVVIGLLIHRWPAGANIMGLAALELFPPILVAVSNSKWVYWAAVFPALCVNVIGADSLYIISNLVISREFPKAKQGLAGGVFNTTAQFGKSLGLSLSSVVSAIVTKNTQSDSETVASAKGYQASFWFCLGLNVLALIIGVVGLRSLKRIGTKDD